MSKLVKLTRGARAFEAPNWVADAIDGALAIGNGSYARVYGCKDGSALKITRDRATMSLAKKLARSPLPGFAPVWRASHLTMAKGKSLAVSMPTLFPLNSRQAASVKAIYGQSLAAACRLFGFEGSRAREARIFACKYAAQSESPRSSFSACLCIQIASRCLPNPQGSDLRRSLIELASFCETFGCDIDLLFTDNWMADENGRLVLSDHVVHKAYAF